MIALRNLWSRTAPSRRPISHLVRDGIGGTPPLFVNQLVHVILRNVLDDCEDAFMLRAAELFFRPQRLTSHGGSLIAADDELIAQAPARIRRRSCPCSGCPPMPRSMCSATTMPQTYWARSDRFDMALDLTVGRRGLAALGEVIVRWLTHLLSARLPDRADRSATRRRFHLVCRPRCAGDRDRRCAVGRRGSR